MARWSKPSENLPYNCFVGDRVLGIVLTKRSALSPLRLMLTILELTENGWKSDDGYDIHDLEFWAYETSVTEFARELV